MANIFKEALRGAYQESVKPVSYEAFEAILENRRSVRVYEKVAVPDEIIERCLRAALMAPNSSNLQPWEFYWIQSEEAKSEVAKICLSQPAAATAPVLIACVARTDTWDKNRKKMLQVFEEIEKKNNSKTPPSVLSYYKKIVPFAYSQGVWGLWGFVKKIIFFFRGLKVPTVREPTDQKDMSLWAVKSTALACQNLMMALSASGYDSCPMEGYDSTRLKKYLKLEKDAVPVMVISAGKRAANGVYGPRTRFAEADFIKKV